MTFPRASGLFLLSLALLLWRSSGETKAPNETNAVSPVVAHVGAHDVSAHDVDAHDVGADAAHVGAHNVVADRRTERTSVAAGDTAEPVPEPRRSRSDKFAKEK